MVLSQLCARQRELKGEKSMELTGIIVQGLTVAGFQVKNSANKTINLRHSQMVDLAKNGKIDGVTVSRRGILLGIPYNELPRISLDNKSAVVLERLENGGYLIEGEQGKREITAQQLWAKAVAGYVTNIKAGLKGTEKVLGAIERE